MGVSVYQDTFNKISGGTIQIVSGLPFQPKALIFWGSALTGTTITDSVISHYGFSDGTNDCVVSGAIKDNEATSTSVCLFSDGHCIYIGNDNAVNTNGYATVVSLNPDGFTLTWGISDANTDAVHYMAIGGDDITNVKVGMFDVGIAAPGSKSYTGVGFQPDVLFTANNGHVSATPLGTVVGTSHFAVGLSAMKNTDEEWTSMFVSTDNVTPTETYRYQRRNKCFSLLNGANGTVTGEAEFTSFDADGFTWNYTTTGSNITNSKFIYLAIKGGEWDVGSQKLPATDIDTTTVTANGPTVKGVFVNYVQLLESDIIPTANAIMSIGGTDGTRQSHIAISDLDNVSPSATARVQSTSLFSKGLLADATATSSTVSHFGAISAFNNGSFEVSWTNTSASQYMLNFVAVSERDPAATLGDALSLKVKRPITQTVSISDGINVGTSRSLADILANLDAILRKVKRPIADTITNSDTITTLREFFRSMADTVSNSDAILLKVKRPIANTITNTDVILQKLKRSITDSLANLDSILLKVKRPIADSVIISDMLVGVKIVAVYVVSTADTIVNSDIIALKIKRPIADSITNSDTLAAIRDFLKSTSDSLSNSDSILLKVKRPIVDAITNSDAITILKDLHFSMTDSISNLDSIVLKVKRPIDDTITNSDTITALREYFRSIADTITISDTLDGFKTWAYSMTDSLSNTDAILLKVKRTIMDTITNIDIIAAIRNYFRTAGDTVTITDVLRIPIHYFESVADTVIISDIINFVRLFVGGTRRGLINLSQRFNRR